MKPEEIDHFKQLLLLHKLELNEFEQALKESSKPVRLDQAMVGRLSRMDALQGQQMAMETARRQQQQLVKIEAALQRIAAGEYGHCFVCGEEIDIRRLAADPTSTRCMGCMET